MFFFYNNGINYKNYNDAFDGKELYDVRAIKKTI